MRPVPSGPVLSTWRNGDRLIGEPGSLAQDLYAAGTPPMHGLAARPTRSVRVALIRVGDRLPVHRDGDHWVVSDAVGVLGRLRWRRSDHGRLHAVTGVVIRLPISGVLVVERLLVSPEGVVVDFSGYVEPT